MFGEDRPRPASTTSLQRRPPPVRLAGGFGARLPRDNGVIQRQKPKTFLSLEMEKVNPGWVRRGSGPSQGSCAGVSGDVDKTDKVQSKYKCTPAPSSFTLPWIRQHLH